MSHSDLDKMVVVGSSRHAKVVIDAIERQNKYRIVGLLDPFKSIGDKACGYEVLGGPNDIPRIAKSFDVRRCFIAIGDNWVRHVVSREIVAAEPAIDFVSVIHPSAQVARGVTIGCGTILLAGAIVNTDSAIGCFCVLNTNASLDHDSVMEDFSSLAPGVATGGKVRVGSFSAVAIGASVIQDRTIGRHSIVGAGAVVLKDIPDFCVAYGVPAKVVRKRTEGERYL